MTQTATKCLGVTRTAKNSDAENYYPMMLGPSFYHEGAKYEDYNDFANPMFSHVWTMMVIVTEEDRGSQRGEVVFGILKDTEKKLWSCLSCSGILN